LREWGGPTSNQKHKARKGWRVRAPDRKPLECLQAYA